METEGIFVGLIIGIAFVAIYMVLTLFMFSQKYIAFWDNFIVNLRNVKFLKTFMPFYASKGLFLVELYV